MNRSVQGLSLVGVFLALFAPAAGAFECEHRVAGAFVNAEPEDSDDQLNTACGQGSSVTGTTSTAMGASATAGGDFAIAAGASTNASGDASIALGNIALATGAGAAAIGYNAVATATNAAALGILAAASGGNGTAIGPAADASGEGSTSIGALSEALAPRSTALGFLASANQADTVVLGAIDGINNAVTYADVGIGTQAPLAPLHVFRDNAVQEFLYLDSNAGGGPQDRAMMYLANNGGIRFEFENRVLGTSWRFQAATGASDVFEIAKVGTGDIELTLDALGNLQILGTLTELSDRNAKQDIDPLEGEEVLARLEQVNVSEWSYRTAPGQRHAGPMAQDFHAAFGYGGDDRHISPRDMAGVNMAAVKALNEKLERRNADLEARLAVLEALVAEKLAD